MISIELTIPPEPGQMTLGQLIDKIQQIADRDREHVNPEVFFDFGNLFPVDIYSWRGVYAHLALQFGFYDYGGKSAMDVHGFLEMIKAADGAVFYGYKGGKYKMGRDTPIWVVGGYSEAGSTYLHDVVDMGYKVVLTTKYSTE